ncbi:hypothetical protein [Leptospira wolffii]|uniref:hypothetical protein n=1 Tax=Leptospira wolffii TaxID=409998 RepID=UPI00058D740C|nr:hypothetical protein [Leptospira wolffii]
MKIKRISLYLLIFSFIHCLLGPFFLCTGERCPPEPDPIWTLFIDKNPTIKLKAPPDRGILSVIIQSQEKIDVAPSATSQFIPILYQTGLYSIISSTEGELLNENDFDFKNNMKDGIFLREDLDIFSTAPKCYLFDGGAGTKTEISCY